MAPGQKVLENVFRLQKKANLKYIFEQFSILIHIALKFVPLDPIKKELTLASLAPGNASIR